MENLDKEKNERIAKTKKQEKVYKIVYTIASVLIIVGAVIKLLHFKFGISGGLLIVVTIFLTSAYQGWLIGKLFKQLKGE